MRAQTERVLVAAVLVTALGCTAAAPAPSGEPSVVTSPSPESSTAVTTTPTAPPPAPATASPETTSAPRATASPTQAPTTSPRPSPSLLPGAVVIDASRWPMLVLAGDDAVWGTVYEATERSVVRIDPGTNATTTVVGPLPPAQIASIGVGGTVWVADWDTSSITGYDIATGDAVAELPVGLHPIEPVAAFGDLWSLDHHGGTVTRIDTETRTVEATITVGAPGERGPNSAAAGGGLLWVVTPNTPVVVAIDPETSTIARRLRLDEDTCVSAVSYVADRVWLRECDISRVIVLDPRSGEHLGVVDAVALGVPLEIAGDAWVVTRLPGQTSSGLAKVDPDSLQIIDEFETGERNEPLLFVAFDSLWIVAGPQVTRVPLATVTEGG